MRPLDFLSIYVKEKCYQGNSTVQIKLIRGLLKALSVAHKDQNKILFDRTKSVLTLMAKQNQGVGQNGQSTKASEDDSESCKVLLTEMMQMLLR